MPARIEVAGLQVDSVLHDFIVNEALPGTGWTLTRSGGARPI